MSEYTSAQEKLAALMKRVFEDGVVDPQEREEMRTFWATHQMKLSDVKVVVNDFLEETWGEVLSDGIITKDEREQLAAVVETFRLPKETLPSALLEIIEG